MTFELPILFAAVFGLIAAAMAFLIVFEEYRKHQLSNWRVWREAVFGSAFAFAVLVILSIASAYLVSRALR